MKKNMRITPEGTRDFLFEECGIRRQIEGRLAQLYQQRGYSEVVTPVLEFFEVFENTLPQERMFKLCDGKNRLLALRADSTSPAMRIAASRLRNRPLPLRLYYNQNIYRTLSGASDDRSTEIAQSGVELLGAAGIRADLEIIHTALDVLAVCGAEYRFELGDVGFFKALIADVPLTDEQKEDVRGLIESKNFAALGDFLRQPGREEDDRLQAIGALPHLFGGEEVFQEAERIAFNPAARERLTYLRSLYDALSALGLRDRVSIDLGIVQKIDYYSGLVFVGYLEGAGEPVLSGGRYDTLSAAFGLSIPATGFAVDVDAIARLRAESGGGQVAPAEVLLQYDLQHAAEAFQRYDEYLARGVRCELSIFASLEAAQAYAAQSGIKRVETVGEVQCGQ